jgi:hypothetical protein
LEYLHEEPKEETAAAVINSVYNTGGSIIENIYCKKLAADRINKRCF